MKRYPYIGISTETYASMHGSQIGFHPATHDTANLVDFGKWGFDSAYLIEGTRNLKSHIDKIVRELRNGNITGIDQIIIEVRDNNG